MKLLHRTSITNIINFEHNIIKINSKTAFLLSSHTFCCFTDSSITSLNSNLASKIGIGDVVGTNIECPVVFGAGSSFAASSGIALPNSARYNITITSVRVLDAVVDYTKWQLRIASNSFCIYTSDSALISSSAGKYGYAYVTISLK